MSEVLERLGATVAGAFPDAAWHIAHGDLVVKTGADRLLELVTFLRDDPRCLFACIIDITAVDWPERDPRFDVVYHFLSPRLNARIRLKIETDEATPVPSLTGLYPGANWYEREAYDLYGVLFSGHPDLRRLLTDYGFEGHPLRKDFPMTGYVEVRYDDTEGRVVYEPVKLQQEFRNYDFLSPWEGDGRLLPGDEKAAAGGEVPGKKGP